MKKITINGEVFGPFLSVEVLADAYRVTTENSVGDLPFSVVGQGTVANWTGELPGPEPVDLVPLKAQKNTEINEARLAANYTSFTHAGKAIACDTLSRSDIDGTNGYVSLNGTLPPGWPGGWKTLDNSYVAISDVAGWKSFYLSMFATGNANFAKAQTLKAQLAAATTAAQINAINW